MKMNKTFNIRVSQKDLQIYELYSQYLGSLFSCKVSFSSWVRSLLYAHITTDKDFREYLKKNNINISF